MPTTAPSSASILLGGGRYYDFRNPSLEGVDVEHLAHSLSRICRFTGHCARFYSVAEHSVWVSRLVPPSLARQGLVHDLHEALVGDVSSPLKALIPDYKHIEQEAWAQVAALCDVPLEIHPLVKRADLIMLGVERRHLMPADDVPWGILWGVPDIADDHPGLELGKDPEAAFRFFMDRYEDVKTRPQEALVADASSVERVRSFRGVSPCGLGGA